MNYELLAREFKERNQVGCQTAVNVRKAEEAYAQWLTNRQIPRSDDRKFALATTQIDTISMQMRGL